MDISELIATLARGEDSHNQFKQTITTSDALAAEMVAFANANGGRIYIGVRDNGSVLGVSPEELAKLNNFISNAGSHGVQPALNPVTTNISHPDGLVVVVEIQRMFQRSGLAHGDEVPAGRLGPGDVDLEYFEEFFQREFGETVEEHGVPLPQLLSNMNLCQDDTLNVAGALLFCRQPHYQLPVFIAKGMAFPGTELADVQYLDSRDFVGKLAVQYYNAMAFLMANLRHIQGDKSVNSVGDPEIPRIVLEELLANAFIHRDLFVQAPVRLFIFADRVELISPGHLPNNLTVENIILGNSNIRNPILASFATKLLPYRGIGSGIRRALKAYPHITFEDDRTGNQFRVTIARINP